MSLAAMSTQPPRAQDSASVTSENSCPLQSILNCAAIKPRETNRSRRIVDEVPTPPRPCLINTSDGARDERVRPMKSRYRLREHALAHDQARRERARLAFLEISCFAGAGRLALKFHGHPVGFLPHARPSLRCGFARMSETHYTMPTKKRTNRMSNVTSGLTHCRPQQWAPGTRNRSQHLKRGIGLQHKRKRHDVTAKLLLPQFLVGFLNPVARFLGCGLAAGNSTAFGGASATLKKNGCRLKSLNQRLKKLQFF